MNIPVDSFWTIGRVRGSLAAMTTAQFPDGGPRNVIPQSLPLLFP